MQPIRKGNNMPSNYDLGEKIGRVMGAVEGLADDMKDMKPKIEKIETYISRQKGIVVGVGGVGGIIGAIIGHFFK